MSAIRFHLYDWTRDRPIFMPGSIFGRMTRWAIRLFVRRVPEGNILPPFWFRALYDDVRTRHTVFCAIPLYPIIMPALVIHWAWDRWRCGSKSLLQRIIDGETLELSIALQRAREETPIMRRSRLYMQRVLRASDYVAFVISDAYREGAEKDEPEGARYITISDTAARVMVRMLREGLTDEEEAEHQKRLKRYWDEKVAKGAPTP